MARVLIVGCGCRGQALARSLLAEGHAVRGTSRDARRLRAIAALGAEAYHGDPDRIGSLLYGFDGVTVVCWLLGSATGPPARVQALHGPRLEMLFAKLVDTTVRGVLYESTGSVATETLDGGRAIAERARTTWEIPVQFLTADPANAPGWLDAARSGLAELLAAPRGAAL